MNDDRVYVLFTMDVEIVAGSATASGPGSNAEGAQRIREYMEVLGERGFTPTFFVDPQLGPEQAELFLELRDAGAEIGMHIHAAKFSLDGRTDELGALTAAEQKAMLMRGLELFERHFQFRPRIFRPGCFSANDHTYGVLAELGFEGGSISIPGRVWMERYCEWSAAEPHPHYANAAMRQYPGSLPFVEIPLSVDRSQKHRHPLGFEYYFDLRPGDVYQSENVVPRDHRQVLENIVRQLAEEQPLLKTIVIDVHNDRDFRDLSQAPAQHLRTILDNLAPILAAYGLNGVNATYTEAIRIFKAKADVRPGL